MKEQDCTDTITQGSPFPIEPALGRLWREWLVSRLQRVPDRLLIWLERSRQRRHLGTIDDRMLRDLGLTRADAWAETQKWFWQR